MAGSWIGLALAVIALVAGGVAEELLPKCFGVGFPVLLSLVHLHSVRHNVQSAILFAIAAGAIEDSISALPFLTSVGFFVLAVVALRRTSAPRRLSMALAYPAYHLWLAVWVTDLQGSIFQRMLVAVPLGLATAFATAAALQFVEWKAGADEAD